MRIKTSFSIKDLENLSGVKAHTIRIWEKRYELLHPERSDSNIRTYDLDNLQKLLNVSVLIEGGLKVSKVAQLSDTELYSKVKENVLGNDSKAQFINAFKVAMLNFDQELFDNTYNKMLAVFSFREIFQNTFLPLLEEIGILWMTNTITPSHERFISTLIQQKLLLNIERVQGLNGQDPHTYVLFLPDNEIHELGLLYVHFELLLKGYKSIYLGSSVPMNNLKELQNIFENISFVSYFTVQPPTDSVIDYVNKITEEILQPKGELLHILGRNTHGIDSGQLPSQVRSYPKITEFLETV